jgi:hypothetical protein
MNRRQSVSAGARIPATIDQRLPGAQRNLRALAASLPNLGSDLEDSHADCWAIAEEHGGWILRAAPDGRQISSAKRR